MIDYRVEYTRNLKWKHEYKCFCGNTFVAIGGDVNSGRTTSCGCYSRENSRRVNTKHGLNKTPEHRAWVEMKRRCSDSSRPGYHNYGGRGIKVAAQWLNDFSQFLADMGTKPSPEYSLDKIDNDKDYGPDNCRWANKITQARNQRRHAGKVWNE